MSVRMDQDRLIQSQVRLIQLLNTQSEVIDGVRDVGEMNATIGENNRRSIEDLQESVSKLNETVVSMQGLVNEILTSRQCRANSSSEDPLREKLSQAEQLDRRLIGRVSVEGTIRSFKRGFSHLLELSDGTVWKIKNFLGLNLNAAGWKPGDSVEISRNKSWFSSFSYFFYNPRTQTTTPGNLIKDAGLGDKYRHLK